MDTTRKGFPILGSRGVTVDWQLVAEHNEQVYRNHGQTLAQLAARGGLDWCELHAVLHDKRFQKLDGNEALIACRALELRYLAAIGVVEVEALLVAMTAALDFVERHSHRWDGANGTHPRIL